LTQKGLTISTIIAISVIAAITTISAISVITTVYTITAISTIERRKNLSLLRVIPSRFFAGSFEGICGNGRGILPGKKRARKNFQNKFTSGHGGPLMIRGGLNKYASKRAEKS
jgi:hypothetical protein